METNQTLTPIQLAIKLSKSVLAAKMLLQGLRSSKSRMLSIKGVIFHEATEGFDKAINDISYTIDVTEKRIYSIIKPFLGQHDYNYPNKYSFSAREMVEGFATIERIIERGAEGKIVKSKPMALLLSTHELSSDLLDLSAGRMISFEGHEHVLKTLPSIITQQELEDLLKPSYSCTFNVQHLFKS